MRFGVCSCGGSLIAEKCKIIAKPDPAKRLQVFFASGDGEF